MLFLCWSLDAGIEVASDRSGLAVITDSLAILLKKIDCAGCEADTEVEPTTFLDDLPETINVSPPSVKMLADDWLCRDKPRLDRSSSEASEQWSQGRSVSGHPTQEPIPGKSK